MEDTLIPIVVCGILFIGLPWIIFHYVTKWKQAATLTSGDEKLLDELHDAATVLEGFLRPKPSDGGDKVKHLRPVRPEEPA